MYGYLWSNVDNGKIPIEVYRKKTTVQCQKCQTVWQLNLNLKFQKPNVYKGRYFICIHSKHGFVENAEACIYEKSTKIYKLSFVDILVLSFSVIFELFSWNICFFCEMSTKIHNFQMKTIFLRNLHSQTSKSSLSLRPNNHRPCPQLLAN